MTTLTDITADPDAAAFLRAIDDGERAALGMLCDYAVERGWEIADGLMALRDIQAWPFTRTRVHGDGYSFDHIGEGEIPFSWWRRCKISCTAFDYHPTPSAAILEAAAAWPGDDEPRPLVAVGSASLAR